MQDFEKLGVFYLGREFDLSKNALGKDLVLYDARDLVTHAVCVGMTGSGKTGLCVGLLEESVIDRIPAIVVDPKGDLGNLLLTFPDLADADFLPCPFSENLETVEIRPKKTDISVDLVALAWFPYWRGDKGEIAQAR